jgi:uncharacterized BrkB/YihY/UPF0761 family membrane protein
VNTSKPLDSAEISDENVPESPVPDVFHQGPHVHVGSWEALWGTIGPSLRFFFRTEVHVYAFAVAANILISFFPFLVAIITLCQSVLHWRPAVEVIIHTLNDYFPDNFGVNFRYYLLSPEYHKSFSWLSVLLLLFTANGIFIPLEVAFNRIWRVKENRSFLRNQVVSYGLIFVCGALVLASVSVTALNVQFLTSKFAESHISATWQTIVLRAVALPITTCMIFLVYWLLPNAKIPVKRLIPPSIAVAVLLEISKYVNILTWPWLRAKLRNEVPPFVQSISIILWSFVATMIVLAGAEWSARVTVKKLEND